MHHSRTSNLSFRPVRRTATIGANSKGIWGIWVKGQQARGSRSRAAAYSRDVVSFVDILGFKNIVATSTPQQILEILRQKNVLTTYRLSAEKKEDITITYNFSDLIVNVTPLPEEFSIERKLNRIFFEVENLGFSQWMLAKQGIFVRGGITVGEIFTGSQTIFGPALIDAYELESKYANWPIIALDRAVTNWIDVQAPKFLEERIARDGESHGKIFGLAYLGAAFDTISRTEKELDYIDYLHCVAHADAATGDLDYLLQDHKSAVCAALAKYPHCKYEFVARYHNQKCSAFFPEEKDLLIDGFAPLRKKTIRPVLQQLMSGTFDSQ